MATPKRYRPRSSYYAKSSEGRAKQLDNLKSSKKGRKSNAQKFLDEIGNAEAKTPNMYPNDPTGFITDHFLIGPKKPIVLMDFQKDILRDIFLGKSQKSLALLGMCKKSGKSTFAAAIALWMLCNIPDAELYLIGPDKEQTTLVMFSKMCKSIRHNPILAKILKVKTDTIENKFNNAAFRCLATNTTNAGVEPDAVFIDEMWQLNSMEARRALDELTTIPSKEMITIITSYAGFENQTDSPLYELYSHGKAQAEGREKQDEGFYFTWRTDYKGVPWVSSHYLKTQRARLRANTYSRLHENRWVSASEQFITSDALDRCIDERHERGLEFEGPCVCAIDLGLKRDSSAIVVCGEKDGRLVLVDHAIFQPLPGSTLDIESTVEQTVGVFASRYDISVLLYDPWQCERTGQLLRKQGINAKEFPQTSGNCILMSESLHGLIMSGLIVLYPDVELRRHILSATALESERGVRITKMKSSLRIDACVALAMSAMEGKNRFIFDSVAAGLEFITYDKPKADDPDADDDRFDWKTYADLNIFGDSDRAW